MRLGMGDEDEKMRARVLGYRMIEDFKNAERESESEGGRGRGKGGEGEVIVGDDIIVEIVVGGLVIGVVVGGLMMLMLVAVVMRGRNRTQRNGTERTRTR